MALASYRGPFHKAFFQIPRFNSGDGYPGLVMASGQPVITRDLAHDGRYLRSDVKQKGFRAYVCVPCEGPGGTLGSLQVAYRTAEVDLERTRQLLAWASRPIGMALGAAILELRESARTSLLAAWHRGEKGLEVLARNALRQFVAVTGAESGILALFGTGQQGVPVEVRQGLAPLHACAAPEPGAQRACPALAEARAVVRVGPRQTWRPECLSGRRVGAACYCVPLLAEDTAVGLVHLFFARLGGHPPTWNLPAAELLAVAAGEVIHEARQEAARQRRTMMLGRAAPEMAVGAPRSVRRIRTGPPPQAARREGEPRLDIRCLGPFELWRDGAPVTEGIMRRKKALTLLKLLLGQRGHPASKDFLIEALWPEADPAAHTSQLYVLVHELRQLLEPSASGGEWRILRTENNRYFLDLDAPCVVDVVAFEALIGRARQDEASQQVAAAIAGYEAAVSLYRGDYMEDEPYADWCWQERERLRETCLDSLARLANLLGASGEWPRSVSHLRHALRIDRLREEVHRELMFSLWAAGRRDEAVRQYETCRRLLHEDLDVSPVPETERLLHRIRTSPRP